MRAMASAVSLRADYTAADPRRLAAATKHAGQLKADRRKST